MIINVTDQDIQEGVRKCWFLCPVALALSRVGFLSPSVGATGIFISMSMSKEVSLRRCYPCPDSVKDFINKFDNAKKVEPFEFELVKE